MKTIIKVGSRGSQLALTQTEQTLEALRPIFPEFTFEKIIIKTKGDLRQDIALEKFGDKGIFVQEIEDQLLRGEIDIAVHSMKDMPSEITKGLSFALPPKRVNPHDVLVTKFPIQSLSDIPYGAKIGTGSKRRLFQIQQKRPDVIGVPIRGNVDTRIKKIESENLFGVILAAAGLERLGIYDRAVYEFPTEEMIPAPAQGALALQYKTERKDIKDMLEAIADPLTHLTVTAERTFLKNVEGSCHVPIGAYAKVLDQELVLHCIFGDEKGEKLVSGTYTGPTNNPIALGEKAALDIMQKLDSKPLGKVYLLGAGPGDPDLITVKGKRLLESCDAVVFDRLGTEKLMQSLSPHIEKIHVGKASGHHSKTQDQIHEILLDLAHKHKIIVRLKGGDPFVFGRGGEEGQFCYENKIPFEVVPGISSSIAGLTYAGIPITQRGVATNFHVFTGHFKSPETTFDWKTISKLQGTLVFLMAIESMHHIAEALLNEGMDPELPVAMISKATTPEQITWTSTLKNTSKDLPNHLIHSPALFVIGQVIKEREVLNWFESKPLWGMKVGVMRNRVQATKLTEALTNQGAQVLSIPLLDFKCTLTPESFKKYWFDSEEKYTHIIFTSENAVQFFMKSLFAFGGDARGFYGKKLIAIGPGTAKALQTFGLQCDAIPDSFTQEGLIQWCKENLQSHAHVFIPCSSKARPILADYIQKNHQGTIWAIYDTQPYSLDNETLQKMKSLVEDQATYWPFTSGSNVAHFKSLLNENKWKLHPKAKCFAIGPVTADALKEHGYPVHQVAKEHSIQGLIHCMQKEYEDEKI